MIASVATPAAQAEPNPSKNKIISLEKLLPPRRPGPRRQPSAPGSSNGFYVDRPGSGAVERVSWFQLGFVPALGFEREPKRIRPEHFSAQIKRRFTRPGARRRQPAITDALSNPSERRPFHRHILNGVFHSVTPFEGADFTRETHHARNIALAATSVSSETRLNLLKGRCCLAASSKSSRTLERQSRGVDCTVSRGRPLNHSRLPHFGQLPTLAPPARTKPQSRQCASVSLSTAACAACPLEIKACN